jgi:hypothetical protein
VQVPRHADREAVGAHDGRANGASVRNLA